MVGRKYTIEEIVGFLEEYAQGTSVAELVRKYRFSEGSFYRWKKKYGAKSARTILLEEENKRLQGLVAELTAELNALKRKGQSKPR